MFKAFTSALFYTFWQRSETPYKREVGPYALLLNKICTKKNLFHDHIINKSESRYYLRLFCVQYTMSPTVTNEMWLWILYKHFHGPLCPSENSSYHFTYSYIELEYIYIYIYIYIQTHTYTNNACTHARGHTRTYISNFPQLQRSTILCIQNLFNLFSLNKLFAIQPNYYFFLSLFFNRITVIILYLKS
jgi:hypothetical protein